MTIDIARLGLEVDSSDVPGATIDMKNLTAAAKTLEKQANKLKTTYTPLKESTKLLAFQKRQLALQAGDVAQSLALGAAPMQVLLQQGPQIAQIYGPEQGGVGRAFKELGKGFLSVITRAPILTGAVGVLSVAFLGLRKEIQDATGEQVTFGDTGLAIFNVLTRGLNETLRPAIGKISEWFGNAWKQVINATKTVGNAIIGTFVAAFNGVKSSLDKIVFESKRAWDELKQFFGAERSFFGEDPGGISTGNAFNTDFLGQFFNEVSLEAARLAKVRVDEITKSVKNLKNELSPDNWEFLRDGGEALASPFIGAQQAVTNFVQQFVSGMQQGKSAFEAFREAGLNVLNQIIQKLIELIVQQLFFNAISGGGGFGAFGASTPSNTPIQFAAAPGVAAPALAPAVSPTNGGGQTNVVVTLSSELQAQIREENKQNSVKIVQSGLKEYNKSAGPEMVKQALFTAKREGSV